jgi:hypothetical protein
MSKAFWLLCAVVIIGSLAAAQTTSPAPTTPPQSTAPAGTASQENTQNGAPATYPPPSTTNPPATYDQNQPPQTPPQNNPNGNWGQRTSSPTYPSGVQIPAGVTIRATLDTPLSTKTSQVGDRFTATVADPVRDNNGQIAIPVGTKINGQVSQSEQGKAVAILRGKGRLDLRFVDMTLPSGQSTPLAATLKQVTSTSGSTQNSDS